MRVVALRHPAGLDALRVEERIAPSPGPGQVRVRWRASTLNFHDYSVAMGLLPAVDGRIPMSDGAGEVIETGPGVTEWQPGDRVLSVFFPDWQDGAPDAGKVQRMTGDSTDGCACEEAVVQADALTAMPAGWSWAEAATLPCAGLTAWRALVEVCAIRPGDRVLVQGTGGMALAALHIAKLAGATVYATSSSEAKLERLRQLGADVLLNYRSDERWGDSIHRLSGGGVDHVIDSGGESLSQSVRAARVGGNVVVVGVLGGLEARLNLHLLIGRQPRIQAIAVGSRRMQQDMVRALEKGAARPVLDRSFPLEQLADAFRYQASGRHFGKIVLELP